MSCFSCFNSQKVEQRRRPPDLNLLKKNDSSKIGQLQSSPVASLSRIPSEKLKPSAPSENEELAKEGSEHIAAQTFTFRELVAATENFSSECLIGEGGFGRVYKGLLENTGQTVAVKQLDRNGLQGNREFLVEVLMLSLLHHPNLVNLIGYCADGDQRLLVYEYMPLGCLEDHLHDLPPNSEQCLDWNTRMKIAVGAARGLEYLHDKANPPVIYRDFKSSNILLDEGFHPKLSDFGLAKLGPVGDKTHVSTRVMGTYGYCAPEYAMTGQLTLKSDVYSFGVVLLELITGRRAIDDLRAPGEHNLVAWARPLFKDKRKHHHMADPLLHDRYPMRGLYQALAVAAMCLQEEATARPLIGDVVTALNYLATQSYDPRVSKRSIPTLATREVGKLSTGSEHVADEPGLKELLIRDGDVESPATEQHDRHDKDVGRTQPNGIYHAGNGTEEVSKMKKDAEDCDRFVGERESLQQAGKTFCAARDRERAVAEAKLWGESWRERKRGNLQVSNDGFDVGLS